MRFRLELLDPRLDVDRDERELRVEPTRDREMPLAPFPWPRYISTLCRCDEAPGPFRVMSTWY
ncbi:MAG TPA: hypothetical protein QF478_05400, partial [Verrucomicrobiota bacterium]|nr:hypothetical protein [Verrucomicrobiota bacterium]